MKKVLDFPDKSKEKLVTATTEEVLDAIGSVEFDWEGLYNLRRWLETAITDKGGMVYGAGCGVDGADIGFELEGHRYSVVIKPIQKNEE